MTIPHDQDLPELPELPQKQNITGKQRVELMLDLLTWYRAGYTVSRLAIKIRRSYGFTHGLLKEALKESGGTFRRTGFASRSTEVDDANEST